LGAGREDPSDPGRDAGEVQNDTLTKASPASAKFATRTPARPLPGERSAHRQFVDAVVAFSDDPGPENLERYLAASRLLEESRDS
jgi:hypothetical protein